MARRSRKNRNGRVTSANARRSTRLPRSIAPRPSFVPTPLTLIEDRRTFFPAPPLHRPAISTFRPAGRLVVANTPNKQTKSRITFADPTRVLVCVRRGIRREILHAKGVAGSKGLSRPRRNPLSAISCKR